MKTAPLSLMCVMCETHKTKISHDSLADVHYNRNYWISTSFFYTHTPTINKVIPVRFYILLMDQYVQSQTCINLFLNSNTDPVKTQRRDQTALYNHWVLYREYHTNTWYILSLLSNSLSWLHGFMLWPYHLQIHHVNWLHFIVSICTVFLTCNCMSLYIAWVPHDWLIAWINGCTAVPYIMLGECTYQLNEILMKNIAPFALIASTLMSSIMINIRGNTGIVTIVP